MISYDTASRQANGSCQSVMLSGTTVWLLVYFFATAVPFSVANAQTSSQDASTPPQRFVVSPPKLAVKWSPLHLWYFYPSSQWSLEHRLTRKLNVQYEAGWVRGLESNSTEYDNKRGYRLAVELRYFIPSPRFVPFYVAAGYSYQHVKFDRSEAVGYNCGGDNCDYFQYVTYGVKNEELGPSVKFGLLLFPGWRRNRSFFCDLNSGFAYHDIAYTYISRPEGANVQYFGVHGSRLFEPDEEVTGKMRFVVGVRLCYRIL